MKGPFTKKVLPDFWFITDNKRTDGRSGHMYTCPFAMTVSMFIWRFKLRNTHSVNWERSDDWFHTDDRYESARIIARPFRRDGGFAMPCLLPDWIVKFECWLHGTLMYWRWRLRLKRHGKQKRGKA